MSSAPPPRRPVTRAVIPAAGLGTRFLPATKATPKEMLPVVDKPAIQYVVEEAVRAGIEDICIVTSRDKRALEDHFDRNAELEQTLAAKGKVAERDTVAGLADLADIAYVRQGEALGLGHAISVAARHVGDQPFLVMLADEFMDPASGITEGMLAAHREHGASVIALQEVGDDEISRYGCAAVDQGPGKLVTLRDMVEKPPAAEAPSNLAVMGRYVLTPEIFACLEGIQPGSGGELQLTDAIALLLEDQPVLGYPFSEGRYDTGQVLDYLEVIVELTSRHPELGDDFNAFLRSFVAGLDR